MNIITLAVVVSLVLLGITAAIARSRFGARGVCWFSGVATVIFLCVSPVVFFQSFLSLVFGLVCAKWHVRPRSVVLSLIGASVISYGIVLGVSLGEIHELERLRKALPPESVANRLAYEVKATRLTQASPMPALTSEAEQRLEEFDCRGRTNRRRFALQSLHDRTRDEFVWASGFGQVRMFDVRRGKIELPESEPIPLPSLPQREPPSDPGSPVPLAGDEEIDQQHLQRDALLSMHSSGQEDFLEPERFGFVKDRDHVVGFVPHRFTKMPEPQTEFQLVRLELVSLLKHETPVAYVSNHLPQMDELRDAPTRPLDDFERQALDQLRSDEDLVIDDAPNRIRMVGSLRAGKDCLECHSVRRGELLGAFSYELIGGRPVPVKERAEQGPDSEVQAT